ncbi:MAG TPA: TonB-dependent receptor [Terriglobales bacterium]|nr:TonB-dependent receptor [Terriglobales bacterium]
MRSLRFLAIVATLLLIATGICFAQTETGQISGTVKDASDAVVANAKVTVKSINTGLTREATTNSAGLYTVSSLRPDKYEVTVEATGFQKYTTRLEVTVGSRAEVSARLVVGTSAVTVEVLGSTEGVAVNTETSTLSQVVSASQVSELPSLNRNPYDLVSTAGNVSNDQQSSGRGTGFSINGQRSASTDILLDGGENVDTFTAGVGQSVPMDSVQEFSVLTSNFTAEYGRASGGVVNVVTKGGTNSFHGSAYEYNRVSKLTANTEDNNSNGVARPHYTRNLFGYSVGGPIIKDKLFFFNSIEWTRVRSSGSRQFVVTDPSFLNITDEGGTPLIAQATRDYFNAYGTLRPGLQTLSTVPWGQAVGVSNCDPVTDTYLNIPCSQAFGDVVSYNVPSAAGGGSPQNTYSIVGRVDYSLGPKNTLFVRYALTNDKFFEGVVNDSPYVGYDTGEKDRYQNWAINFTHVFNPSIVSTSKVIYGRLFQLQPLGSAPLTPGLFTTNAVPVMPGTGYQYVMPGYVETSTANALPFGGPQNLYQFFEDMSWTRGKHLVKFGGNFIQIRDNRVFGAYENAVQILGSNFGDGLNNFVTGQTYQFEGAVYPQGEVPCYKDSSGHYIQTPACTLNLPLGEPSFERNFRYNDFAAYVQDSWKVVPRFTFNYGIRWEYFGVQHNSDPSLDSNFYLGTGATVYDRIRNGSVMPAENFGGFWKPGYRNLGPRLGFAWDVFGDGKTSLRGGYGISFERNFGNVTYNVIQNPPNYAVISIYGEGQDVATQPIYTSNLGAFSATSGSTYLPNVTLRAPASNVKTAYAENYSLSIDRELMKGAVVSVEYTGSHGVKLYDIGNINTAYYGSTYLGDGRQANRLNYQYGNINYRGSNAWSKYNGVNVKFTGTDLRKTGINLTANYTYSHSIDLLSSTFSDGYWGNYWLGYTDYFNPQMEKGNSDFDARQRISLSAVWQTPWYKNAGNSIERYALGGWEFAPIFTAHTGNPYTVFDCWQGVTICPRYSPNGFSVPRTGHAKNLGGNRFSYVNLPIDPNENQVVAYNLGIDPSETTNLVAGWMDALQVPATATNVGYQEGFCGATAAPGFTCSGQPMPGRNNEVMPGAWNLDLLIAKNFKVTEKLNLQFRTEMYDAFNHHNLYIIGGNLDVTSMDVTNPYTSAGRGCSFNSCGTSNDERRFVQFALKVTF